jgi:hypothetical protein
MERGESFEVAVGRLRPPPHFRQKAALKAQCARWRLADIATGISAAHEALRQTRLKPALEQDIAGEIIVAMAQRNAHSALA